MTAVRPVTIGSERFAGEGRMTIRSPYDTAELAEVPACEAADVGRAVHEAHAALKARPMPVWQRAEVLERASQLLEARVEHFAEIIAREAAKPIATARAEAERAANTFRFAAVAARTLTGETIALDAARGAGSKVGFTMRVPVGVIGAITPFNFPLNLVAHKVAPAIASGCPVVLKPASQTPLSAMALSEMLLDDCGLPPGYLNVVTGSGRVVGDALVHNDDVAMITFTGSPEVGWGIRAAAARKRVALELGNNSPVIVEADADWERAARAISVGGFSYAGQTCISTQRVYVQERIFDQFAERLATLVADLVVGSPYEEVTDVSALISADERDRVASWIQEAEATGAEVLCGGKVEGSLLWPTVLANVSSDMRVCRDEVFGPVVGLQRYADLDEAIDEANETRYGLQAGIFTSDLGVGLRAARELDFGGVLVNEVPTWRADQMPYGGIRDSGNTKEGPAHAVREMTEERVVILQP